jgi:hypothetical protein
MATIPISQLGDALQRRTLALFVGADLPRAVTGLPSRADLAKKLAKAYKLDPSPPLAEVAQRVSRAGSRFEFTDFLRHELDITGRSPQPFHHRLVELAQTHGIQIIITTAYDSLLVVAFEQAAVGRSGVVWDSDLPFVNPAYVAFIWLYGRVEVVDALVVTEQDHWDLLRDRRKEGVLDEVKRAFRRNTVLFLGYDLSDPDFRFLFGEIAGSRFARTAYAVWPGLPESDVLMWRDRGIEILEADPLGILEEGAPLAVALPEPAPLAEESSSAEPPPIPAIDPDNPPIAAIRELLTAAFTVQTLPRFCKDRPVFRPVLDNFGLGHGLTDMVDELIEYCETRLLWDQLLAEVAQVNAEQCVRFVSRL